MDIAQSILEAIDTVVSQRLTNLQFDNTVACTIIDNSNKAVGKYTVEFQGTTKFYAYSDYKEYAVGLTVYVLVPGGDWNARKQIIGCANDNETELTNAYIHPMDTIAVYGTETYGDTAIVSVEFEVSTPRNASINNDDYGYTVEVPVQLISANSVENTVFHLTSANILGDPWDLPVPQKVSIRAAGPVGGKIIVSPPAEWKLLCNHPTARVTADVERRTVVYGFDLASRENKTVEIHTQAELFIPATATEYTATLSAFWIHKNDNNSYRGFEQNYIKDKKNAQIILSSERDDKEAIYYWIAWFQKEDGGEWKEVSTDFTDTYTWTATKIASSTTFQARIYRNGEEFFSNEITFISGAKKELLENAPLTVAIEGEQENFNLYGLDGETREIGPYKFKLKFGGWTEGKIQEHNLYNRAVSWRLKTDKPELSMVQSIDPISGDVKIKPSYGVTLDKYNTIEAQVTVLGQTYTAEKTLRFSTIEQSGNGYYIYINHANSYYDFNFDNRIGKLLYSLYKDDQLIEEKELELGETEYETLQTVITTTVDNSAVARKTVPLAIGTANYRYAGPTSVIYDSYGGRIKSQKLNMALYYNDTLVENAIFKFSTPQLKEWKIKDNTIIPPDLYIENNALSVDIYIDDQLIWRQGIAVFQNKYGSQFINDWDGSLILDEKGKSVMSAMIGAGTKSPDGQFTGVFMGDVSRVSDNKVVASGLLGYKDGVQTFGFNTDGSAFIGKSGSGRIYFNKDANKNTDVAIIEGAGSLWDLTNGVLQSSNFKLSGDNAVEGMSIDFPKSKITAAKFCLHSNHLDLSDAGNFILNPTTSSQPLIDISANSCTLQSLRFINYIPTSTQASTSKTLFYYSLLDVDSDYVPYIRKAPKDCGYDSSILMPFEHDKGYKLLVYRTEEGQYIRTSTTSYPNLKFDGSFNTTAGRWYKVAVVNTNNEIVLLEGFCFSWREDKNTLLYRPNHGSSDGKQPLAYTITENSEESTRYGGKIDLHAGTLELYNGKHYLTFGPDGLKYST